MSESFRVITKDQLQQTGFEVAESRVIRNYDQKPLSSLQRGDSRTLQRDDTRPEIKDSRFQLSELARPYLPVHQEEERRIESEVRKQVAAVSRETYDAAFARGTADGQAQGRSEACSQVLREATPILEGIRSLLSEFEGLKDAMYRANERFLVELILRISRKVCLKEVATDPDYVNRLVKEMISQSGARDHIRIRLNSGQVDAISKLQSDLLGSRSDLRNLHIELSEEVPEGACELETHFSSMMASIDSQIEAIHREMVKS